jgi:hypothetical protein
MQNQQQINIVADIISDWLSERASHMREGLAKRGMTESNSPLAQGIAPSGIIVKGDGFSINIELEDYYEFIDQGVQGIGLSFKSQLAKKDVKKSITKSTKAQKATKPNKIKSPKKPTFEGGMRTNTGVFKFKNEFVGRKMVQSIQDWGARRGRENVTKQNMLGVAFATAKKVKRLGIEQTLFFTDATQDKYADDLSQRISDALGKKYEVTLL